MNPYVILIGLFIAGGLATSVWGAIVLIRGRRSLKWPTVAGIIEKSTWSPDDHDLLPEIEFSYKVDDQSFRSRVEFPRDLTPTAEFSRSYVERHPVGALVTVFYDPVDPGNATLEPGSGRGDWLILALGVSATLVGVIALVM